MNDAPPFKPLGPQPTLETVAHAIADAVELFQSSGQDVGISYDDGEIHPWVPPESDSLEVCSCYLDSAFWQTYLRDVDPSVSTTARSGTLRRAVTESLLRSGHVRKLRALIRDNIVWCPAIPSQNFADPDRDDDAPAARNGAAFRFLPIELNASLPAGFRTQPLGLGPFRIGMDGTQAQSAALELGMQLDDYEMWHVDPADQSKQMCLEMDRAGRIKELYFLPSAIRRITGTEVRSPHDWAQTFMRLESIPRLDIQEYNNSFAWEALDADGAWMSVSCYRPTLLIRRDRLT